MLDGISLLPLLKGDRMFRFFPIGFQSGAQMAMIDNKYKLYSSDNGESFALYDIDNDPEESKDVSLDFPEIKDTLINQLNI